MLALKLNQMERSLLLLVVRNVDCVLQVLQVRKRKSPWKEDAQFLWLVNTSLIFCRSVNIAKSFRLMLDAVYREESIAPEFAPGNKELKMHPVDSSNGAEGHPNGVSRQSWVFQSLLLTLGES